MNIMAIDSSGLVASVAIANENGVVAEYTVNNKKTHSQTLLPMLDEIRRITELQLDKVDAIAIASGPGSFTGLRIGSATAKGIALALELPIVEVSTLEALASNLYGTAGLICPIMDARRNQVYTAVYKYVRTQDGYKLMVQEEPCAVLVDDIVERINNLGEEVIFLGDGVPVYKERLSELLKVDYDFAPIHLSRQRAGCVAACGINKFVEGKYVQAALHSPDYLRLSQAERERLEKDTQGKEKC